MNNIKEHPFHSIESFVKWSNNSFGCVHCKYLEITDLPVDKWKCTHEFAFTPNETYHEGIEYEKEWIRQNDLENGLNVGRDANLYFMCFYFANEQIDLQQVIKKNYKK